MPWDNGQVMEGVMDILYRLDGQLWVADYKTDAVEAADVTSHAERYRTQGQIYKRAATRCLREESVRFHCLFLHCGKAVEL
jgi:ATP-dependent helicase/nuclease subunit A